MHDLTNILSAIGFVSFLLTGLSVVWAYRRWPDVKRRRRAVNLFLLYCLIVSIAAGTMERDAWPFSHGASVSRWVSPQISFVRIVALDSDGAEHRIDYRAWQPFSFEDIIAWVQQRFDNGDLLSHHAWAYLLRQVEEARQRAYHGQRVGHYERILGVFSAPAYQLQRNFWSTPETTPKTPFIGFRVYEEWRQRQAESVVRIRLYEYLQP